MRSAKATATNSILRHLPSVDELLRSQKAQNLMDVGGEEFIAAIARKAIETVRQEIVKNPGRELTKEYLLKDAENSLDALWTLEQKTRISKVINSTGVILHTNLGRAPLSENARRAVDNATGYCTLEYDLETGKRGGRGGRAEDLITELTGGESALIVNNCAAAAFLILTVFASGGGVVISRGELVEIGGDFRVPDVLSQSGATLCEVGTTNRTKLSDYEKAIDQNTKLILRVHPSNYRIVGFTSTPTVSELADLAHKHGILLYEDLGSGALMDLSGFGLTDEPVVSNSISAGADVVSFSGDKLLGGPQAGIIVGRREMIRQLRSHPLYRVLRVDKIAYAALDATLEAYRRGTAAREIPVLQMLSAGREEIEKRVVKFFRLLSRKVGDDSNLRFEIIDGSSAIGGGAAPVVELKTKLLALTHKKLSVLRLEHLLRSSDPPVIARIVENRVVIDLRTVAEIDEPKLLEILTSLD